MYNLTKDKHSEDIIKELEYLPLIYKGNIKIFDEYIDNLKKTYNIFNNFLVNYFVKNKRKYFIDKDFDYYHIPNDARANSYLENYNKIIKTNLGHKRKVNWVNLLTS